MSGASFPSHRGLYDASFEHDSCGVGFLVNVRGKPSHDIVRGGIRILENLRHRGACGCDPLTGDGAGILVRMPDAFLRRACAERGVSLPPAGDYGAGLFFLPPDADERQAVMSWAEAIIREEGGRFLGWRDVPHEPDAIGEVARSAMPVLKQLFIGRGETLPAADFELRLYVIRKRLFNRVQAARLSQKPFFYCCSLSSRTLVYKGQLMADQLDAFFPDLSDPAMASAIALVHSRYSTNTFPSWALAHPYRMLAHNGEINTLRGNKNWMHAREALFACDAFGGDMCKTLPVVMPAGSDSATFDNVLEMLVLAGRPLPQAVMMMIPEAWQGHESMSAEKKAFYRYHSCLMEPWDGPAAVVFTDGRYIGAVLDRNGLRPLRFWITTDDRVVMASETGVLDIPPRKIAQKGRIRPGRMFLVDTAEGRLVEDEEIKARYARQRPYGKWLKKGLVELTNLPAPRRVPRPDPRWRLARQRVFGYTLEDIRMLLKPMALEGSEAVGSMGADTPLAVLSERPQLLFNYFKQLFAQVTNPPIDPIREEVVMAEEILLGAEENLLAETPAHCRRLCLERPILTDASLARIRALRRRHLKSATLPILFDADQGPAGLAPALEALFARADAAMARGATLLILSDRNVSRRRAPIPSLLACAGLHHHLIRQGTRTRAGILLETGEAREMHHFAVLIGYGANAVNPWLALETIAGEVEKGDFPGIPPGEACENYLKATRKGLFKIISKMGISTLQSYCGAQIFEAVGLSPAFIDRYFTATPSRIGGIGIETVAAEALCRHREGYPRARRRDRMLDEGGFYHWRKGGEHHQLNPRTIALLQQAVRQGDAALYREYARTVNQITTNRAGIRGLLQFKEAMPIPLHEVEPAEEIVKRFATGAMSYGSISREAHETLAIAMNRLGGFSNTGEGGEDAGRFSCEPDADCRRSRIKQVAQGRFGVTIEYLVNADQIQIKMAQGAKPGEGGQLPGYKVSEEIARTRHTTPGVGLISPAPHHDIYSIEDLAQLIHDLKNANPRADISVKLVSEVGVGTVAAGVAKGKADHVLISGYEGGTGASPQTSIKHAGLPMELGIAETQQVLVQNDLRGRIRVQTDGQLKTGRDVVIAAMLGADEFGFSTVVLVTIGCILLRKCHLNTCSVGIATQDPELRKRFTGKPEHVVNFFRFVAEEVREIMAGLGIRKFDDLVGRVDLLETAKAVEHWKGRGIDLSAILHQPDVPAFVPIRHTGRQDHGLEAALDHRLIEACRPALENREPVAVDFSIQNTHRTVGTMLSSEVARRFGLAGLPDGTIRIRLAGSAGQSFGAFLARGVELTLAGDANDYVGKGLSGGRIIVRPPEGAAFVPEENIVVGNVVLYGAILGEAFFQGQAGERFAVRNSGAHAVVEGVGDHGCEYMTGGRVVVLGGTGRNFAAGMSGGIAYVWNRDGDFARLCNPEMVDLFPVERPVDMDELNTLIRRHLEYTQSRVAAYVLEHWDAVLPQFVKVYPRDYRRVLETDARTISAA